MSSIVGQDEILSVLAVSPAASAVGDTALPTAYPPPLAPEVLHAPGPVAEPPFTSAEEAVVQKALCLGGDVPYIAVIMFARRKKRYPREASQELEREFIGAAPGEYLPPEVAADQDALKELQALVEPLASLHAQATADEFDRIKQLEPGVSAFFPSLENYRDARAMYCEAGYTRPDEQVFGKLKIFSFLSRARVPLHEKYLEKVSGLPKELNKLGPDLAETIARRLKSVGGFNPRRIANRRALSNHALGLAVDIDPEWNPHIVNPKVIAIIRDVTRGIDPDYPNGYDFGARFVQPGAEEGKKLDAGVAYVTKLHGAAVRASNALRDWLRLQLQREKEKLKDVEEQEQAVAAAEKQAKVAATDTERAAAAKELEKQRGILGSRQYQLVNDPDLKKLRALRTEAGKSVVEEQWAVYGVQNLPLEFVVAMKTLGFRWGDEYQDSKDGMHFELVDAEGKAVVKPDSAPIRLDDLFEGIEPP